MMPVAQPRCVIWDLLGLYWDELGLHWYDRDEPGTTGALPESIKMFYFNTSAMNRESPGKTSNDQRSTGNNQESTGNNQDGTVSSTGAHTDPGRATATPRLSPVVPRWNLGEYRQSPGIAQVHQKIGALPGRNWHLLGLRWGITGNDLGLTRALP
ncbi:hypothetical protein DPMN_182093 [Dreissena polymorpha]|uniref:Uncharacterized protein n=1 Tax=Dreissena polymorpha TaxID=45954 RepID=A0A9D4DHG0_DREPO|nr:hypothetical protein DPMN_182093 [Dreissena polymorpha]